MDNTSRTPLKVNYLNPQQLKPYANNARQHSKRQIQQIAESIRTFGFTNPVLIDGSETVIAGHGRVEAAKSLGLSEIPTIRIEHLTEAQKKAYILADNRLAEKAGWDRNILSIELQHLMTLETEFDITVTGFEMGEIDKLVLDTNGEVGEEAIPTPPENPTCQPGDLWQLGEHRIFCGNALEEQSYQLLLESEKAQMVFTDPPYNVPIQGHVSGLGQVKHEEFAMASGEMTPTQFTEFLEKACRLMATHSQDGSLHFIFMDWRHVGELLAAGQSTYAELKNICIWNKDRGGMGALYRSKHEMVFVFKKGKEPHINNISLGKYGRYRSNVWDYPAISTFQKGPNREIAMHPTVKPISLIADAIMDCSERGGLILDPFGGSGSSLCAAEKTGRKARLLELEPRYVDVTIARWERLTGKKAVLLRNTIKQGESQ